MANNFTWEDLKNWIAANFIGLLALVAGFVLLMITYKIILNLIIFSVGLFLVYTGLIKLHIKPVTDFIDRMTAKIKKFFA
jgi:hypothetical protein